MDEAASRYELLDLIGAGGMAEVYRARMLGVAGFEKLVAIKRILGDFCSDQEFVQRFVDEARLTARLVHPNICQILDFGVMEGRHFIAMEFVDGLDLSGVLSGLDRKHERMPLDIVLYVTCAILRGLKHAHEASDDDGNPLGIVHRDVSPHNVLLSVNGDVKLSDLGAATANPGVRSVRTQKHFRLGKVLYMAPEQRRVGPVDGRADVYSTGILLTEMVLGVTRFQKIANMYLAGLCSLSDEVRGVLSSEGGRAIAETIDRATQEDPVHRYQTAGEMLTVVDRLLVELAPGTTVDRVARLVERLTRHRNGSHRGPASVSGPVEAYSLRTADLLSFSGPADVATDGLDALPTDPTADVADEVVTVDEPPPSGPEALPVVGGLDDVPTTEAPVVSGPLPMGGLAGDGGDFEGLDDAPTLAMRRPPRADLVDPPEPDTVATIVPTAHEEDRSVVVDVDEFDASGDGIIEGIASRLEPVSVIIDSPKTAVVRRKRDGRGQRSALRRAVVATVLALALVAGLGVGAILARDRFQVEGGSGRAEPPPPPSASTPDASSRPDGGVEVEPPPPVARVALEIGATRDAGAEELDAAPDAEEADGGPPRAVVAPKRRAFGYLNINSQPYGIPYVDDVRVGPETPVAKLKVVAGRHRVKVFFPQEERAVVRGVRIRPGETRGVVIRLED